MPFMKIVIDERVELDDKNNFLVNVGYLRVSTDKQAEQGYGLDVQEENVIRYCKMNNVENLVLFIDDGYTGTNMNRPALNGIVNMIDSFNRGYSKIRINSMIIPRIDRLGRTLLGTLQFIQDYIVSEKDSKNSAVNHNKQDINFISVAENFCRIERNNPQGKFMLMLFATLAEFDRDQIVEKLHAGQIARVSSGKYQGGGGVPYGYRYDKASGKLVVMPDEARNVREIFRLFVEEGLSPGRIAAKLGFSSDVIVRQIIMRKSLTGCLTYKDIEVQNAHEAIISLSRWREAQEILASRARVRGNACYPFAGLLYCGDCGAKMRYQKQRSGKVKIVCYSRLKSRPGMIKDKNCPNVGFWADDVEDAILEKLFKISTEVDSELHKTDSEIDIERRIRERIDSEKQRLARLYSTVADGAEMDDVLSDMIEGARSKIKKLETELSREQREKEGQQRVKRAAGKLRNIRGTWDAMTDEERHRLCTELIHSIELSSNGKMKITLRVDSIIRNES